MRVRPATYFSRAASHSAGWPGAPVFGYGLTCRWLASVGPLAGALEMTCSELGPSGSATMMNRCQVPLASPSESSEATLRKNSAR